MAIMFKNGKNVRCDNIKTVFYCLNSNQQVSSSLYLLVTKPSQMCYLTAISLFLWDRAIKVVYDQWFMLVPRIIWMGKSSHKSSSAFVMFFCFVFWIM